MAYTTHILNKKNAKVNINYLNNCLDLINNSFSNIDSLWLLSLLLNLLSNSLLITLLKALSIIFYYQIADSTFRTYLQFLGQDKTKILKKVSM